MFTPWFLGRKVVDTHFYRPGSNVKIIIPTIFTTHNLSQVPNLGPRLQGYFVESFLKGTRKRTHLDGKQAF